MARPAALLGLPHPLSSPAHLLPGCTRHAAEEACALEACYVAAFRMKQRGLVLHEKLDKAAVRAFMMPWLESLGGRGGLQARAGAARQAASPPSSRLTLPPWRAPATPPQVEKLRLAAEMLPPDEAVGRAARLVEQCLLSAPWALTDAFVAHFRCACSPSCCVTVEAALALGLVDVV